MRTALCVCLVLIAACGDDGIDIETSSDTVCAEIAEVACHNMYQCCTEGEIQDYLEVSEPRTQDQCRVDVERACIRTTATLQHSISENKVRFDSQIMNTCLQSLAAPEGTCADVVDALPWTEACMTTAWVGIVPVDGECKFAHECGGAPDSFCAPNQTCKLKPGHGEPCGSGCSSGTYCSLGICQPRLPVGGQCMSTTMCQKDLFCDTTQAMPTCKAREAGGAMCTSNTSCLSGQCLPGTCAGPTPSSCFEDDDCTSRCADDNSPCATAANCATGTCMMSGFPCTTPTSCGAADTCVFPVACVPGDCLGEPVCSAPQYTIDYCEDAISQLPAVF